MSENSDAAIENMLAGRSTAVSRDLKLNLKKILESGTLSKDEAYLGLLATATAVDHEPLKALARQELGGLNIPAEQIEEAAESAAIMAMLNVYYRFRYMVDKEDDYHTTGLRMNVLARPLWARKSSKCWLSPFPS